MEEEEEVEGEYTALGIELMKIHGINYYKNTNKTYQK